MPSSFSPSIRAELIADNEQAGSWGQTTNRNFVQVVEEAITATTEIDVTAGDVTLSAINGGSDQSRRAYIRVIGAPVVPRVVTAADVNKVYMVTNMTGQDLTFKALGQAGVVILAGETAYVRLRQGDSAQQVRLAALGVPANFSKVIIEGSTADPISLLLVNQTTPLPDVVPIAKFQRAGVDVMTVAAEGTTIKGPVSFPDVSGGGFLPLAGGVLSGNVRENRAGSAQYLLNITDALADHKAAMWLANSGGEMRIGYINDLQTTWLGGMVVRPDYKVYDLATSRPFAVEPATGGYLPLAGGTISPNGLTLQRPDYPYLDFFGSGHGAGKQRARLAVDNGGGFAIGRLTDTASGWVGGLSVGNDGAMRDLNSGGVIWHSANDGQGSGLDAHRMGGYDWSWYNTGNTHVTRHSTGRIEVGEASASGGVCGGPGNSGYLNCYGNTGHVNFRWDGNNLFYRINEAIDVLISKNADHAWNQGNPGFLQIGPIIFNWGVNNVQNDGSGIFNLAKPWSGCFIAQATPWCNANIGGEQVLSAHVLWVSASQISVGCNELKTPGVFPICWLAIGW